MRNFIQYLFLSLFLSFSITESSATHIKAAEISAVINPFGLTTTNAHRIVKFTLTTYCDKKSIDISQDPADFCAGLGNCASLNFGDGSVGVDVQYTSKKIIDNNTYKIEYDFVHTYAADRFFEASYMEENRINRILNLTSPSNSLAFYINFGIVLEASLNSNQTPKLSLPPIDLAQIGKKYNHNPGAFDPEGDSIAYKPYQPQIGPNLFDNNYVDPDKKFAGTNELNTGNAIYSVNAKTGDIIWDAPAVNGFYTIAFIVEEWRITGSSRKRISFAVRDMLISVTGDPLGMETEEPGSGFSLFPNPFTDNIFIKSNLNRDPNTHFELWDNLGNKVADVQNESGTGEIKLNNSLKAGMYHYRISSGTISKSGILTKAE